MIGKRLKEARNIKGFTQSQMASMIGVEVRSYQFYESGDRFPKPDILLKIADSLSVSIDWLFERDDFLKSLGVDSEKFS